MGARGVGAFIEGAFQGYQFANNVKDKKEDRSRRDRLDKLAEEDRQRQYKREDQMDVYRAQDYEYKAQDQAYQVRSREQERADDQALRAAGAADLQSEQEAMQAGQSGTGPAPLGAMPSPSVSGEQVVTGGTGMARPTPIADGYEISPELKQPAPRDSAGGTIVADPAAPAMAGQPAPMVSAPPAFVGPRGVAPIAVVPAPMGPLATAQAAAPPVVRGMAPVDAAIPAPAQSWRDAPQPAAAELLPTGSDPLSIPGMSSDPVNAAPTTPAAATAPAPAQEELGTTSGLPMPVAATAAMAEPQPMAAPAISRPTLGAIPQTQEAIGQQVAQDTATAVASTGTPSGNDLATTIAETPVARGTPEAASARQLQQAEATFVDHYASNGMQNTIRELRLQGRVKEAQDFQTWVENSTTQRALKTYARAGLAAAGGDMNSYFDAIVELHSDENYYPDGWSINRDQSEVFQDDAGNIEGVQVVFEDKDGNQAIQRWEDPQELLVQSLGMMAPEEAWKIKQTKIEADAKAAEVPASVQALEYRAREAGLVPGSDEYRQFMANGGRKDGMSITTSPDGSVSVQTGDAIRPGNGKSLTEAEGKNTGFFLRSKESHQIINGLEAEGTDFQARLMGAVPFGLGNYMQSPEYQQFDQARRDFINATLRRESGAVISDAEFANAEVQYFPQPGDSPSVIAQKRRNRENQITSMEIGSGDGTNRLPVDGGQGGTADTPPPAPSGENGFQPVPDAIPAPQDPVAQQAQITADDVMTMAPGDAAEFLAGVSDLGTLPDDVLDALIAKGSN